MRCGSTGRPRALDAQGAGPRVGLHGLGSLLAGLLLGSACSQAAADAQGVERFEASGVVRRGEQLLLVHDDVTAAVFRLAPGKPEGVRTYKAKEAQREPLPGAEGAEDLESIALGDGRLFVISEKQAELFGADGARYRYMQRAHPLGNRGLEGLGIRREATGEAGELRVAALFEGGYLKPGALPEEQRESLGGSALTPFVILHRLPAPGERLTQEQDPGARVIELQVEAIAAQRLPGQRFRAPDLVWHRQPGGAWSWIVLLNSDAPPEQPSSHAHLWLQRFGLGGEPIGAPFDLGAWLLLQKKSLQDEGDWEGLGWWEEERCLVLVDDTGKAKSHLAFVPLPPEWSAPLEDD